MRFYSEIYLPLNGGGDDFVNLHSKLLFLSEIKCILELDITSNELDEKEGWLGNKGLIRLLQ